MGECSSSVPEGTPPPDRRSDPMGDWLADNDRYFNGEISYAELQRRNCERYRSSPPLCGSVKLTDSDQHLRFQLRHDLERRRLMGRIHERMYRHLRMRMILSVLSFACVFAALLIMLVVVQWTYVMMLFGCLILAGLELWNDIKILREFDDRYDHVYL